MNFETVIAWIEDAAKDLLPLVTGELLPEEQAAVTAITEAIAAYKAATASKGNG